MECFGLNLNVLILWVLISSRCYFVVRYNLEACKTLKTVKTQIRFPKQTTLLPALILKLHTCLQNACLGEFVGREKPKTNSKQVQIKGVTIESAATEQTASLTLNFMQALCN